MTPRAKEYLDRLREAWDRGADSLVCDLHDELNEDQELYLEVWGALPSTMRRQIKELIDYGRHTENFDPTPWCHQCGAMRKADCHCGPIADNN